MKRLSHLKQKKKLLKHIALADGKLKLSLELQGPMAIVISGTDQKGRISPREIFLEPNGDYHLKERMEMTRYYFAAEEKNSRINTVWENVKTYYFKMKIDPQKSGTSEYWQKISKEQHKKYNLKKGSYLSQMITYLFAYPELEYPLRFFGRNLDIEGAKAHLADIEKRYFSKTAVNVPYYYKTLKKLNKMKSRIK